MLHQFAIRTRARASFENITEQVVAAVVKSGTKEGLCVVFVPHTTAGVTINENADPDVVKDIIYKTDQVFPRDDPKFRHSEMNSDSHIKTSLVGSSMTLIVENGGLLLGTWQGVYLAEFDGPRTRRVFVKIMPG